MLKLLVTVSLLQAAVDCGDDEFPIFDTKYFSIKGYVYGEQLKIYSYLAKVLKCELLSLFEKKIENLKFLSALQINKHILTNFDSSKTCTVYLLNLIKIRLPMKFKTSILINSFFEMLDQYEQSNYFHKIDVTIDSFGYSPIEQKFFFVDVDKLVFTEQTHSDNERKVIYQNIVLSFYKSLSENKIPLTDKEKELFEKNIPIGSEKLTVETNNYPERVKTNINFNLLDKSLQMTAKYQYLSKRKKIEPIIFEIEDDNYDDKIKTNIMTDNKTKTKNKIEIISRLNGSHKVFTLDNSDDLVMMITCKRDKDHDDCHILNKRRLDLFNDYEYSCPNYRFDVEIHESILTNSPLGEKVTQKLYEIYLIFSPISSPGIVLNSLNLFTDPSKFNFDDVQFFLCEDELMNLAMYKKGEKGFEYHSFIVGINPIEIIGDGDLIRTTQSIFNEGFEECRKPFTKVFYHKQLEKQIIFHYKLIEETIFQTNKNEQNKYIGKNVLDAISSLDLNGGPFFSFMKKCNEPLIDDSFSLNRDRTVLTYKKQIFEFPSRVLLRYENDSSNNKEKNFIECDCYIFNSTFEYVFLNKDNKFTNFYLNFNLKDDKPEIKSNKPEIKSQKPEEKSAEPEMEPKRTVVYVNTKPIKKLNIMMFKKLDFPKRDFGNTFISISRIGFSDLFKIRLVKYIEDNDIEEILSKDTNFNKGLSNLPDQFSYKVNTSNSSIERETLQLADLVVVYLSDTEIIYQTNINLKEDCIKSLKVKNNEILKICCHMSLFTNEVLKSTSYESYKPSEKNTLENPLASLGLYRVLKQVKEDNKKTKNSIASNPAQQKIRLVV